MGKHEEWRMVARNPLYEVSNLGRVRRITYLADFLNQFGYPTVQMYERQRKITVTVHRLVAEAFVENPLKLPQVNHKDGNKLNRSCDNLEWVTSPENLHHARRLGLIRHPVKGSATGRLELVDEQRAEIKRLLASGISQRQIADQFGVHRKTINRINTGQHWQRSHKEFAAKGEDAGLAKLAECQVRCIKALGRLKHPTLRSTRGGFRFRALWTPQSMANHFGVSRAAVRNILDGVTWRHIV